MAGCAAGILLVAPFAIYPFFFCSKAAGDLARRRAGCATSVLTPSAERIGRTRARATRNDTCACRADAQHIHHTSTVILLLILLQCKTFCCHLPFMRCICFFMVVPLPHLPLASGTF